MAARLPLAIALVALLTGCAASDPIALAPLPAPMPASQTSPANPVGAIAAADDSAPTDPGETGAVLGGGTPSKAEIAYAEATAAGVFRRRKAERATSFLPAGTVDGYGLCLRSPARKGAGYDYVLVLQVRRNAGSAISQVDDDTLVMRRPGDSAPCRTARLDWVGVG
ncbi:hypothetical protein E3C22_00500 [Jiella endophytica]|uniref:Uncharacterized protein n=1 Tax=Jiella endophytica TaxID=2558362 RepID=A0A4Y8RGW5_9HYPH|nr:hypothetical protein [Jiella endophytica]TFF20700.1 hypothetical protein E3C22_17540 [Jiella endophytica]TFF27001.1 hypothetical protein E3C22_00500 [Jiella endophytica]